MGSFSAMLFAMTTALLLLAPMSEAQLSTTFYSSTCPTVTTIVRNSIVRAITAERRMAASLIRLHFHDCFVQGCDASILLDETATIQSEKTAFPNRDSVRGYEVIETAKAEVEQACPGVVSCADILTLAARDASVAVSGPTWDVRLGRRDSTTANRALANANLPGPGSDLRALIESFDRQQLTVRDMVALSGSHTIGQAQCSSFRTRIYSNGTDIDADFAATRREQCPPTGGNTNLAPLDLATPNDFDNNYFTNLMQRRGLLQSDQVLFNGGSTDSIVSEYSVNPATFEADFASAMIKMSEIPRTETNGIIRRICSAIN